MRVKENNKENKVDFATLESGDCFRYCGELLIKTDGNQCATSLEDGGEWDEMCGEMVTLVNAEVQIID
jgi:hypothetical protein